MIDDSTTAALLAMATFGFTGSFHCVAMCGPLAASACGSPEHKSSSITAIWQYHATRLLAYATLGFGVGLLTAILVARWLDTANRYLGVAFGTVMTCYGAIYLWQVLRPGPSGRGGSAPKLMTWHLGGAFRRFVAALPLPRPVAMGLATALLPCGFLLAALLQASMLAHPVYSTLAMLVFGMSSSPALLAASGLSALVGRAAPRVAPIVAALLLLGSSLIVVWRAIVPMHHHTQTHCHDS